MLILEIAAGVFIGLSFFHRPLFMLAAVLCYAGAVYIAPFVIGAVWLWVSHDPDNWWFLLGGLFAAVLPAACYSEYRSNKRVREMMAERERLRRRDDRQWQELNPQRRERSSTP
jgi:hypothetical protein